MQFGHAIEELPFGEPLNARSAWEVKARAAICPCSPIGVLRSCPCFNLLAGQGVMAAWMSGKTAAERCERAESAGQIWIPREWLTWFTSP